MRKLLAAVCVALACVAAGAAGAQSYSPAAKQVLARARAATGGDGWNQIRGYHETGRLDRRPYERWHDPLRYGARVHTEEPGGQRVHAFNGVVDWQILPTGQVIGTDERIPMARARTEAFFAVNGFFYPSRFAADGSHIGVRQDRGRSFDLLRVQPIGGEARELWFDRATGRLDRIVDRSGPAPVVVSLSDYRKVGPVIVPFRSVSERGGRSEERLADAVVFTPVDRTRFTWAQPTAEELARPAPPPPARKRRR